MHHVTPIECRLLKTFVTCPGKVMSRKFLMMRKVWKTEYLGDTRTLEVPVCWLRKKIEEEEERGVRILDPRNSKILNSKPTFRWKTMRKDNIVMVSLTLKGTRGKLWTIQTEETKISYPDGRRGLDRHQTYFLRVENLVDSSLYDEVYFRVLDEKKAAEVMRFAKKMEDYRKLNPDDSTSFFILVVYYMEKELYHKALVELEKLEKENPGERFVLKKRRETFARIGLWTKWQEVNQMLNAMK